MATEDQAIPPQLPSVDLAANPLTGAPPDQLNAKIGVLTRREVEARMLAPLVTALGEEFGRERVLEIVRKTIIQIAREQGHALTETMGGDSLTEFADSLRFWTQDNALEIEVLAQDEDRFDFNVTRCRYAELYRSLGMADLGAVLSCNRDYALIEGFNNDIALSRTQTIMQGAPYCNFRYRRRSVEPIELVESGE
jgi:predicted ArsR family transcriptional regulator